MTGREAEAWRSVDWPWYVRTKRMREQRWLLDNVIRQVGVDWDQGRTRYTAYAAGIDAQADFARVRERVKSFADIHPSFAAAARRRHALARAAEGEGHDVEAREHYLAASILWGNAEWPLFGHSPLVEEYNALKVECYHAFIRLAPHSIRAVEIPMRDASLPGYLHLPRGTAPFPCVVQIGGMDAFKEHRVAIYGDKFLERGIATLAVDIPGQGESLARGLHLTSDSTIEAGRAILAWARGQPEVDPDLMGLAGNSFGSFWATQMAAGDQDLVGCAVTGPIHEPGMRTIFEDASPTFKARFMSMAGFEDEAAFDEFARSLDLTPDAPRITSPYMVLAGEHDELSPLVNTYRLIEDVSAPVRLVVFEGERHSVGGGPASRFGPNRHHLVADWFRELFAGVSQVDSYQVVDTTGTMRAREPFWRA